MDAALRFPASAETTLMDVRPVTLTGNNVRLEPLHLAHVDDGLADAASDDSIWQYLFDGPVYLKWGIHALVRHLLDCQERGTDLPFAVIDRESKNPVGITRFLHINRRYRTLDIATWYGLDSQRSGINTEAKYLLLRHAFNELHCARVQFEIDVRNQRSIDAIERIGAQGEGVLRKQIRLADGSYRDSAVYSIIDDDWPDVRAKLEHLLER